MQYNILKYLKDIRIFLSKKFVGKTDKRKWLRHYVVLLYIDLYHMKTDLYYMGVRKRENKVLKRTIYLHFPSKIKQRGG